MMDKVDNLRFLSSDKLKRKIEEIEIAIEPLDFMEKAKVLRTVLDNMYQKADIKYVKATKEAYEGTKEKEIIKEIRDGKG